MACIGDETQTESSDVTPAWRQNELHPRAENRSVNTRLKTTTAVMTVIGAVLIGGLAWALMWAITEKQIYRALGILIGAAVGAVVGARHEILILRIAIISVLVAIVVVVCWAIIMIGLRAAVIMKALVTAVTGETGKEANAIIVLIFGMFLMGICPGLLVDTRGGIWQMPPRNAVYFGGGATAVMAVITVVMIVTGVPVYGAVMVFVACVCAVLGATKFWAESFTTYAAIFALEFKMSIDAVIKVAVFILASIAFYTALLILILWLWKITAT